MLALGGAPGPAEIVRWRIEHALPLRRRVVGPETDCYRMLNGDGDGLSGVVVDRYGDVLVMQLLTAGAERMREEIVEHLKRMISPRAIVERSQGAVRRQEGLEDRIGVIAGARAGEIAVIENGVRENGLRIDSTSSAARRPASSSTSAKIARAAALWRAARACWMPAATPGASR